MTIIRCLGMFVLGIIILSIMILCDLFFGPPISSMKIVGWDCNDLIYENMQGQTFKLGNDKHFISIGKVEK